MDQIILHGISPDELENKILVRALEKAYVKGFKDGVEYYGGFKMLNQKEAEAYTGLSETTLWRYRKGKTPLLRNYGEGKVNMFLQRELDKVMAMELGPLSKRRGKTNE